MFLYSMTEMGAAFSEEKVYNRTKAIVMKIANIHENHLALLLYQQIVRSEYKLNFLFEMNLINF
jgi:hypothetical protein